jgi:hypothetical protein
LAIGDHYSVLADSIFARRAKSNGLCNLAVNLH